MPKVYVVEYPAFAGKWIYEGFAKAWQHLGFEVVRYENSPPTQIDGEYYIMATDASLSLAHENVISNSMGTFVFAQPETFPHPWGRHPNFICNAHHDVVAMLNEKSTAHMWSWLDDQKFHTQWSDVTTMPLAFDNLSYQQIKDEKYAILDVCYIGGWANNGFDEKRKIMNETFSAFKGSGLKCGFFINKNVNHEQETKLIFNSKVALNVHDAYQRQLGLDTNERTFKGLGLNGILVSDEISQIGRLFPETKMSSDPKAMVEIVSEYCEMHSDDREQIKLKNRQLIEEQHTYVRRVEELLSL